LAPRNSSNPRTPCERLTSRREAFDHPALVRQAAVAEPVVEPARPSLPELDLFGDHAVSAPVWRARDRAVGVPRSQPREPFFEDVAAGAELALPRCPGAEA